MMKHIFFLLLSGYLLIGLAACKQHSPCGDQLARIDSLADVNPDSADMLLKPTPVPSLKGRENEEVCKLLRIKTDDKLYRPVTHYRDTILQLIDYFEHHPKVLPFLLGSTGPALPYLYAGRIFADLGDAPQALDYYQQALDVQPTTPSPSGKVGERARLAKQRGLILSQIGEQFYFQNLYQNALESFEEALQIAEQTKDTISLIFKNRDIAEQYNYLEKNDSSLLFYQKALEYAEQYKDARRIKDIKTQIARLLEKLGKYDSAWVYIQPALLQIDSSNISATYSIASKVYLHRNQKDSALIYLKELLVCGNLFGKRYAHRALSEFAMHRGNLQAASEHFRQYKLLDDSIRSRDNAETIARMHAAYNYQKHEREAAQLKISNVRKEKIIIISGLVIALLATLIYVLAYRNKQNKLRCARQQQLLMEIQKTLEKESKGQDDRLDLQRIAFTTFKKTDIYKTFVLLSQTQERLVKRDEWEEFSQEFNKFFPDFKLKIAGLYNLSTKQYRVCMLRKVGFGTTAICNLACYEKTSVYSIYKRLYYQATGKNGNTADFDKLLKTL